MNVKNWKDVPGVPMGKDVPGVTKRVLVGADDGAPVFAMRHFEIQPAATSPYHDHDWEHEVFVVAGEGELVGEDGSLPLKAGDAAYVAPGEKHCLRNSGAEVFSFLCVVPMRGEAPK